MAGFALGGGSAATTTGVAVGSLALLGGAVLMSTTPTGKTAAKSIAKGIADFCQPDDPCQELQRQIERHMDLMDRKYSDLFHDPLNLYNVAFNTNPGGQLAGYGTWMGHIGRYSGLREGLRGMVERAKAAGCPIPPRALQLMLRSPPSRPFFK